MIWSWLNIGGWEALQYHRIAGWLLLWIVVGSSGLYVATSAIWGIDDVALVKADSIALAEIVLIKYMFTETGCTTAQ